MSQIIGFQEQTFQFLKKLSENNNKEWFKENKPEFEKQVMQPALKFVEEFGELLSQYYPDIRYDTSRNGSGSMFRIYRDVRFSKDKSPYKTNLGFVFWIGEGGKKLNPAIYVHVGVIGITIYGGQYWMNKEQLNHFRGAIIRSSSGEQFEKLIVPLAKKVDMIGGLHYKRVPRGYDAEHPRSEWLKHTGIYVGFKAFGLKESLSKDFSISALKQAQLVKPLLEWLKGNI